MTALAKTGSGEPETLSSLASKAAGVGRRFLLLPIPDEPEGLDPALRPDLWRMRVMADPALQEALRQEASNLDVNLKIGVMAKAGGVMAVVLALRFLIPASSEDANAMFSLLSMPLLLLTGFFTLYGVAKGRDAVAFMCSLADGKSALEWPGRLSSALSAATSRGVALSPEFASLARVLAAASPCAWADLPVADAAAMAALAGRLEAQAATLGPDGCLTLAGESSEAVHRACEVVMPGALDAAMDGSSPSRLIRV